MKSPDWFVNAGAMPLVGLFLAHLDGAHALVDPAVAIALTVVVLHGHLECQFRVNHLVNALCPPTSTSHFFTGSAFLEGTDWMRRKICSKSATSVKRFFPSAAGNFKA